MTELKDWLNSINFNKTNLIEEDPSTIKDYAPYIINRCLLKLICSGVNILRACDAFSLL